jgi:hypothetical protein
VRAGARLAIVALALTGAYEAQAASCRNYGAEVRAAIKGHVETLRNLEREAVDRLAGLDSRPFDYLLGEARRVTALINDPSALALEKDLERCRNWVPRIRGQCGGTAQAFVDILTDIAAPKAVLSPKPDYASAMAHCERAMGLVPLKTRLRE